MKLSGWHRLWIFLSFIYLCVVVGGAFILYPKEDTSVSIWEIFKEMSPDTGKQLEKYYLERLSKSVTDQTHITVSFKDSYHKIFFPKNTTKEELGALSDEFHNAIPKAIKQKQRSFLFWIPLFWAIPCILLYVLGQSIGWIYRGFKRSK